MRLAHLAALAPLCPVCRSRSGTLAPLEFGPVARREEDTLLEGVLLCPHPECRREYPILDGIPILVPELAGWVNANLLPLFAREDLSPELESLIGDASGPASAFDALRQGLSVYGWSHWGDLDPETASLPGPPADSGLVPLLERGLALAGAIPPGPALDLGCALGRASFELARSLEGPVLGLDLSASFLRRAAGILRNGVVDYPRRRVGLVYQRRRFAVALPQPPRVDFWAADAAYLPLPDASAALVVALNLLDSTPDPRAVLREISRVLAPGGKALLASPYDWSATATPLGSWLGGHSQRGEHRGESEPILRWLLGEGASGGSGLRPRAEESALPWRLRLHERSSVEYSVHLLVAEKA
ncbi:MAG: methyltransferase domain-containing protein [Thermoanaerobaculia bacterium]